MEPEYSNIGANLLRQILKCHEIDKHISDEAGLTRDEMHCLCLLYLERPSCVKNLGELLGLTSTRISKILLSLEKRELVTRSMNIEDHRKEQIMLTEKGRRSAEWILRLYDETGRKLSLSDATESIFPWDTVGNSSAGADIASEQD